MTPTAPMKVILELPSPHKYVQRIARSTAYRLIHSQTPINKSHGVDHKKSLDEL